MKYFTEIDAQRKNKKVQMFVIKPFARGFYSTPACDILGSVTGTDDYFFTEKGGLRL